MPDVNVIDEFIVALGIDPANFTKGQEEVVNKFKKTQEEVRKGAGNIENSAKKAVDSFSKLRNQVIGLFALFTAGKGVKEFVFGITSMDAALGRLAPRMGESVSNMSAWYGVAEMTGGNAASMASSFQTLTQNVQMFTLTGQSSIIPYLRALHVNLADSNGKLKTASELYLDIADAVEKSGMGKPQAAALLTAMGIDSDTINILLQGKIATEAMLTQVQKLGVATKEDTDAAKGLQKEWAGLKVASTSMGRTLMTIVTPALDFVLRGLTAIAEWLLDHKGILVAGFTMLATAVTIFSAAIAASSVGFAGLSAAILATPIGWIIAGIGAISLAGYELVKHWDDIRDWWNNLWTDMAKMSGVPGSDMENTADADYMHLRGSGAANSNDPQAQQDIDSFVKMGWSRSQATGIVANLQAESGGNSHALGDGGHAYGLAQWHRNRQEAFYKWSGQDMHTATRAQQLAFVNYELRHGGERGAGEALSGAGSASEAAAIISRLYERPRNAGGEARHRAAIAVALSHSGAPGAALASSGGVRHISNHSDTRINKIEVVTSATDAHGIARALRPALERNAFAAQATGGPS